MRILLIEDDPGDARLIEQTLRRKCTWRDDLVVESVGRLSDGFSRMSGAHYDIVLLDLSLPDSHGIDTLFNALEQIRNVPLIVLTGLDDELMAIEALKHGAQDYLVKERLDHTVLQRAVNHAIERFRLVRELVEARRIDHERRREMEDFLHIISHDLRRPLVTVHWQLGILKDESREAIDPKFLQYIETSIAECSRMQAMIEELEQLTRLENLQLRQTEVSLGPFIERIVGAFEHRIQDSGVEIHTEAPEDVLPIAKVQVQEILENLIENALNHGCSLPNPKIKISAWAHDSELVLAVQDYGKGIPPERHDHVFRMFERLGVSDEVPGKGIGLAAVQRLARKLGGEVSLHSNINQGTRFEVKLPIGIQSAPNEEKNS